jgi:hypothetical protein
MQAPHEQLAHFFFKCKSLAGSYRCICLYVLYVSICTIDVAIGVRGRRRLVRVAVFLRATAAYTDGSRSTEPSLAT